MTTILRYFCIVLLAAPALGGEPTVRSTASGSHLTISNGMIAALIHSGTGRIERAFPRIYRESDSLPAVEPFLSELRLEGTAVPSSVDYFRNTHVVRVVYPGVSLYYFAPMTTGERVLFVAIEGEARAVEEAAFTWESDDTQMRTLELTYPLGDGIFRRYLLFSPIGSSHGEDGDLRPSRARLQTYRGSLLDDEIQYMRMVIDGARLPRTLSKEEREVAERAIVALKMAQVSPYDREVRARGKIVAELPPGARSVATFVDGCYAIMAFSRVGLREEARDALGYFLRERQPGTPASGSGLLLAAYSDFISRCRDTVFLRETYLFVSEGLADTLTGMIQPNGLMPREADQWTERPSEGQSAFTSAVCAAGFLKFVELVKGFGGTEWQRYAVAAERLRRGIRKHLIAGGRYVKGSTGPRRKGPLLDPASIEMFAMRVLPDTTLFRSHLRMVEQHRGEPARSAFDELRLASALAAFGDRAGARRRVNAITNDGAQLLVGRDAAAYLLALWSVNDR